MFPSHMDASTADMAIFLLIVGARFLVPLLIPRFPLPAVVACLVIDAVDQTIFAKYTDLDQTNYQSYDKALDIYYLTIAYLSVIRNWTNGFAVEVARVLWYYRLVGVVLFELLEVRALLFIFPNTFEYYFIAYEVIRTGWDPRRLARSTVLWLTAFIWVFIKLPQEWWIHIAQNDFTDFVQERVFGVEPGDPWGSTLTNRPWVLLALLAAAAGLWLAGARFARRLPARDWPTRFDADAPLPHVDLPAADATIPRLRWPIVEKVALITFVSVIFGQLLQLGASNLQVLAAVTLVVVVNAGLSIWLAKRGTEWRSIGVQFVVLTLVNTTLLSTYSVLTSDGRMSRAGALFFGLLLTLIIVLYDRFRGMRVSGGHHVPSAVTV
jgi:hypothetical protein